MSVNVALREESSGLHAYTPKPILSWASHMWQTLICENRTPSFEHSMRKSSSLWLSRYHMDRIDASMAVVAQSE